MIDNTLLNGYMMRILLYAFAVVIMSILTMHIKYNQLGRYLSSFFFLCMYITL